MINNADDIINLLESNDEFRNAVRRWVLTEELLGLPDVVSDLQGQMADVENRRSNVERQMLEMQGQIAEMQSQMVEMQSQMVEMQSQMVEMNARLGRLESDVKTIKDDIGALKGWQLQERLHRSGLQQIGDRFDIPDPKIIRAVGDGFRLPDFNRDVRRANKEGVLSDREYQRLINTDMIMSGRRDGDGAEIYVVAEASFALTSADIEKVLYSADLFKKVYPERDVRAALWYVNVDDVRRNAAETEGIELVRTQVKHG